MLWTKIIEQYSYKNKFWDTVGKKIRDCKIYSPFSHFIGKGFISERPTLQGVNLVVLLNEKQTLIENFFLHNDPHKST